jgi:hypothetical protein
MISNVDMFLNVKVFVLCEKGKADLKGEIMFEAGGRTHSDHFHLKDGPHFPSVL